jgi:hypothetical protein
MNPISDMPKFCGTCYVIGSGHSVSFFDKQFFADKFIIGINHVAEHIPCDIVVAKEIPKRFGNEALVVSKHQYGGYQHPDNTIGDYYFMHDQNQHERINFPSDDKIIVSYSTITSALHLACYLGFETIFICGHDCGTIDGKSNMAGYIEGDMQYHRWLKQIEPQTIMVRDWLKKKYGTYIYSLNPFVSLNLEGHKYK